MKTHDILDVIEGFSGITFNYNTLPPIKIKTKPSIFILKRKQEVIVPKLDIIETNKNTLDNKLDIVEELSDSEENIDVLEKIPESYDNEIKDTVQDSTDTVSDEEQADSTQNSNHIPRIPDRVNIQNVKDNVKKLMSEYKNINVDSEQPSQFVQKGSQKELNSAKEAVKKLMQQRKEMKMKQEQLETLLEPAVEESIIDADIEITTNNIELDGINKKIISTEKSSKVEPKQNIIEEPTIGTDFEITKNIGLDDVHKKILPAEKSSTLDSKQKKLKQNESVATENNKKDAKSHSNIKPENTLETKDTKNDPILTIKDNESLPVLVEPKINNEVNKTEQKEDMQIPRNVEINHLKEQVPELTKVKSANVLVSTRVEEIKEKVEKHKNNSDINDKVISVDNKIIHNEKTVNEKNITIATNELNKSDKNVTVENTEL